MVLALTSCDPFKTQTDASFPAADGSVVSAGVRGRGWRQLSTGFTLNIEILFFYIFLLLTVGVCRNVVLKSDLCDFSLPLNFPINS